MAQARHREQTAAQGIQRCQDAWKAAQKRLDKTTTLYQQPTAQLTALYQRQKRFEQDNATNP